MLLNCKSFEVDDCCVLNYSILFDSCRFFPHSLRYLSAKIFNQMI